MFGPEVGEREREPDGLATELRVEVGTEVDGERAAVDVAEVIR